METLTDTLIERVDLLLDIDGEPLLATSSTSAWIAELASRNEALANAVREIALELQKHTAREF